MKLNLESGLKKALVFWLRSFLLVAVVTFFFFKVSLGAILLAGLGTFLITFLRHFRSRQKKPIASS